MVRVRSWSGVGSPLSLAVYVTWLAVAASPAFDAFHGRLQPGWRTLLGGAGALTVLALYVVVNRCQGDCPPARLRAVVLAQIPAALLACWGFTEGTMPALLIVIAGQMAVVFSLRLTAAAMLLSDLVLLPLLAQRWGWSDASISIVSYAGFQVFAAFVTAYAHSAEQARDDAVRISGELLATRQLLLESARGEERLRLSRELHDVVGHKLTALKLQLRLQAQQPRMAPERTLAECERLADELLADVRGVVSALRQYDGIELHQALAALVPALPHPRVTLELAQAARAPGLAEAQALLRCAQEGLTNALRHSGAARVVIGLREEQAGLVLSVADDGRARQLPQPGNGLRGMRERLEALGGRLELDLCEGGGLRLRAWLPRAPLDQPLLSGPLAASPL